MSIIENDHAEINIKSVGLWHLNGCMATFYNESKGNNKKRTPMDTVSFYNKACLGFQKVDILRIAAPAIPYLGHLSCLQLQNNQLNILPMELFQLTSLEELNLGCNQLVEIPIQIGLLLNLKELYLHDNQIKELPTTIGKLQYLQALDLTGNQLEILPSELLRLVELKTLWADHNCFGHTTTAATASITRIPSLKNTCIQSIGELCLIDEESRNIVIQEFFTPVDTNVIDKSVILSNNYDLLPTCYNCLKSLFHTELHIVKYSSNSTIPFLFNVCSQSCYQSIFNAVK